MPDTQPGNLFDSMDKLRAEEEKKIAQETVDETLNDSKLRVRKNKVRKESLSYSFRVKPRTMSALDIIRGELLSTTTKLTKDKMVDSCGIVRRFLNMRSISMDDVIFRLCIDHLTLQKLQGLISEKELADAVNEASREV